MFSAKRRVEANGLGAIHPSQYIPSEWARGTSVDELNIALQYAVKVVVAQE
jgi:hypothetical protein